METMKIYEAVRKVPKDAQRTIAGGRLKGKTDINPMWRIKTLTELFGACGVGWRYTIDKQWTQEFNGEVAAFVNISLYYKQGDTWSEAIPGTGGSMFAAKEKDGIYVSDECFKMATTDAISVACKALGVGADVYWNADATKYTEKEQSLPQPIKEPQPLSQAQEIANLINGTKITGADIVAKIKAEFGKEKVNDLTNAEFVTLYEQLDRVIRENL